MQTTVRPNPTALVPTLRERASKSPVFSAMAHVFAMRERTRNQIVVTTLYNTMLAEGFTFAKDEYSKELEFLADAGIGKIDRDTKGRIRSLKGISVTLQSIGLASIAQQDSVIHLHSANKYVKLPVDLPTLPRPVQPKTAPKPIVKKEVGYTATLVIERDGKKQEFLISKDLPADKILALIMDVKALV